MPQQFRLDQIFHSPENLGGEFRECEKFIQGLNKISLTWPSHLTSDDLTTLHPSRLISCQVNYPLRDLVKNILMKLIYVCR